MKIKILMAILVSLLVILVVSPGIPAGNKASERGQDAGKGPKAPEIEMGMFVNRPLSSPPWYPDECEDTEDTYRWAPTYHWVNPSIDVLVNPTANLFTGDFDDVVAEVEKGFDAWNPVGTSYSATVSRVDTVGPSLDEPDGVNTVSWGTIDGPGGTIAVTYFWYNVRTKELIDCDIVFDETEPWSISEEVPSDKFDVWNVVTHEAGHTLVLSDLRSPRDGALTMHAYTWPGDITKRDLGLGDILGIQAIYGAP